MPVPYGSTLHIPTTKHHLLAATQKLYQKAYLLVKSTEDFFLAKSQENGPVGRIKDKTERAMGVGRRTREEIVRLHQMTALRFQMGGDISHPQPPFEVQGSRGCTQ